MYLCFHIKIYSTYVLFHNFMKLLPPRRLQKPLPSSLLELGADFVFMSSARLKREKGCMSSSGFAVHSEMSRKESKRYSKQVCVCVYVCMCI